MMANSTPNPFSVSVPAFGSTTNSSQNPFAFNTNGSASMSLFGNTTNSTHNPFAAVRPAAPVPAFGSTTNSSQNPFAFNTKGNASTSPFGNLTNSTHNPFSAIVSAADNGSVSAFGSKTNSNQNPFAVNTNGCASMSSFGNMTNSTHNPFSADIFGKPNNSTPNPFAVNANSNSTQNPFSCNHTGNSPFRSMTNSTYNPFPVNATGNMFVFENPTNSAPNPFAVRTNQNSFVPVFPNTNNSTSPTCSVKRITFDGTSTGSFGAPPSSVTPSSWTFGTVATASTGTSGSLSAFTSHVPNKPFGVGPLGSAPSSFSKSSGPILGHSTNNNIFGNKGAITSTFPGTNASVSTAGPFSLSSTTSDSSPPFSFGVPKASSALNKGSKIKPYSPTKIENKCKLLSISSMLVYESKCHEELRWEDHELKSTGTSSCSQSPFIIGSTGSSASPITPQFPISTPVVSTNITPTLKNPFSPSNYTPSSITTPALTYPSPPSLSTSFPIVAPSSNSTPSFVLPVTSTGISAPNISFFPSLISSTNSSTPSSIPVSSVQNQASFTWPLTKPSTLTDTEKSLTNPSSLSWASNTSTGNSEGSTAKVVDCIVAVKDPFGSQSVSTQSSISQPVSSPMIRYGISSMPVIDKPATTRISPLVISRHVSQRPLTLRSRKYHPKSDGPKVAFFDHTDETQKTQKESTFIIPRENPRSMFEATSKLSGVNSAKVEVTDTSALLHEDGVLKSLNDQASSSPPCEMEHRKPVNQKCVRVNPSVPKLHRPDYYTHPSIQELGSAESHDPGYCSHVKDFVVGRHGYGQVKFEGETDVRGMDLDALVYFNKLEVVVYEGDNEKPEIGEGLNKRAEVTLLNVKCSDKTGQEYKSGKMVDKFVEKLKKVGEDQGAEFVSYDAVNRVWKFQVNHFSRYGIN